LSASHYCRLSLNVEGREPQGTVPAHEYEQVRAELKATLEALGRAKSAHRNRCLSAG
jgi:predicted AlkP superfamily phosphohydrolase/phosphomutase